MEVPQVIAPQALQMQQFFAQRTELFFEGVEFPQSCAVNITMTPSYTGRAELPDSLRSLFRSRALVIPTCAVVGEAFLSRYDFTAAKKISRIATSWLSVSVQDDCDFDFVTHGLNSVLLAAVRLARTYPWASLDCH